MDGVRAVPLGQTAVVDIEHWRSAWASSLVAFALPSLAEPDV